MPAPVPVRIVYDDPSLLGSLAASAGSAEFAQSDYARQFDEYMQRMAMDRNFLNSEANRRAEDTWRRNDLSFRYAQLAAQNRQSQEATALQDAFRQRQLDLTERGQDMTAATNAARISAQQAGNIARGRTAAPVDLVPAEGPLDPSMYEPSVTIRSKGGGELRRYRGGDIVDIGPDASPGDLAAIDEVRRNMAAEPSKMVPRDVREQLDYLRTFEGQMSPDMMNRFMVAARSGNLKLPQLMDDVRQALTEPSSRMTAGERNHERYQAELDEMGAIAGLRPADQIQYARRRFGMQDPDIYSDEDAITALRSRQNQLQAILKPVTNSTGRTPTGGNIIKVQTPEQARTLPSGTYFQTPDGRVLRKP